MRQTFALVLACGLAAAPHAVLAAPPTLATYWPHEDGRAWFYDQHLEQFYPTSIVEDTHAKLFFNGTTVAAGNVAAQVLDGVVTPISTLARASSLGAPAGVEADSFLRRLWIARPDLRARITDAAALAPCPGNHVDGWEPILLSAQSAYAQTLAEVAAWRCDAVNTRSWLWLTSNLAPGATSTIPLVPDLADDVTLKLTVFGYGTATVPAGTFPNSLRVDYEIDYGTSQCTDPSGGDLGTEKAKTLGYVRYAPGVGPIESYEEFTVVERTGPCPGPPVGEPGVITTLKLNAPSVPALASSWGRVKGAYR